MSKILPFIQPPAQATWAGWGQQMYHGNRSLATWIRRREAEDSRLEVPELKVSRFQNLSWPSCWGHQRPQNPAYPALDSLGSLAEQETQGPPEPPVYLLVVCLCATGLVGVRRVMLQL